MVISACGRHKLSSRCFDTLEQENERILNFAVNEQWTVWEYKEVWLDVGRIGLRLARHIPTYTDTQVNKYWSIMIYYIMVIWLYHFLLGFKKTYRAVDHI